MLSIEFAFQIVLQICLVHRFGKLKIEMDFYSTLREIMLVICCYISTSTRCCLQHLCNIRGVKVSTSKTIKINVKM